MTAHSRERHIDRNLQQRVHNELMAGYTVNPSARYTDAGETRKGVRHFLIGMLLLLVAVSIPMVLWLHHAVVTAF